MKFLAVTLSLVLGLVSLASANPVPVEGEDVLARQAQCATKGNMCAGFAGIQCCPGLKCVGIPPGVADGSGTCAEAYYG